MTKLFFCYRKGNLVKNKMKFFSHISTFSNIWYLLCVLRKNIFLQVHIRLLRVVFFYDKKLIVSIVQSYKT